jgi:hypothetical protein
MRRSSEGAGTDLHCACACQQSASSSADPEIPEGTEMVEMTVREALNSAMAEEMRSDPDVFLMGEEVAEYQGAYKISQGLLDEFGAKRVSSTRRSPSTALPALRWARRLPALSPSSSS